MKKLWRAVACLLGIEGLDSRSVLEFWVLGIGKKLVHSVFLTDWVLENHGKLFNAQHSIPNTQHSYFFA